VLVPLNIRSHPAAICLPGQHRREAEPIAFSERKGDEGLLEVGMAQAAGLSEVGWTTNGWVKSKTEPITYSKYAFYLNRPGRDAGFKDKLTSYCFRRGCANAIDGMYPVLHRQFLQANSRSR
jgi:hypothetical protein